MEVCISKNLRKSWVQSVLDGDVDQNTQPEEDDNEDTGLEDLIDERIIAVRKDQCM